MHGKESFLFRFAGSLPGCRGRRGNCITFIVPSKRLRVGYIRRYHPDGFSRWTGGRSRLRHRCCGLPGSGLPRYSDRNDNRRTTLVAERGVGGDLVPTAGTEHHLSRRRFYGRRGCLCRRTNRTRDSAGPVPRILFIGWTPSTIIFGWVLWATGSDGRCTGSAPGITFRITCSKDVDVLSRINGPTRPAP